MQLAWRWMNKNIITCNCKGLQQRGTCYLQGLGYNLINTGYSTRKRFGRTLDFNVTGDWMVGNEEIGL